MAIVEVEAILASNSPRELEVQFMSAVWFEQHHTIRRRPDAHADVFAFVATDAALAERGALIVPDILANAGGVIVSYFEWTQNIQQFRWEEKRVNAELATRITQAYRAVAGLSRERRVPMRRGAYLLAVERVAEAITLRGFV